MCSFCLFGFKILKLDPLRATPFFLDLDSSNAYRIKIILLLIHIF